MGSFCPREYNIQVFKNKNYSAIANNCKHHLDALFERENLKRNILEWDTLPLLDDDEHVVGISRYIL